MSQFIGPPAPQPAYGMYPQVAYMPQTAQNQPQNDQIAQDVLVGTGAVAAAGLLGAGLYYAINGSNGNSRGSVTIKTQIPASPTGAQNAPAGDSTPTAAATQPATDVTPQAPAGHTSQPSDYLHPLNAKEVQADPAIHPRYDQGSPPICGYATLLTMLKQGPKQHRNNLKKLQHVVDNLRKSRDDDGTYADLERLSSRDVREVFNHEQDLLSLENAKKSSAHRQFAAPADRKNEALNRFGAFETSGETDSENKDPLVPRTVNRNAKIFDAAALMKQALKRKIFQDVGPSFAIKSSSFTHLIKTDDKSERVCSDEAHWVPFVHEPVAHRPADGSVIYGWHSIDPATGEKVLLKQTGTALKGQSVEPTAATAAEAAKKYLEGRFATLGISKHETPVEDKAGDAAEENRPATETKHISAAVEFVVPKPVVEPTWTWPYPFR